MIRTIRAIVPIALIWGIAWGLVGAVLGVLGNLENLQGDYLTIRNILLFMAAPITILGTAGFVGGAAFAAVLTRAERGQSIDTISTLRTAAWGAVGGIIFSVLGLLMVAGLFGAHEVLMIDSLFWVAVAGVCGAASAAGSLAIARKGTPSLLEEVAVMQRLEGQRPVTR